MVGAQGAAPDEIPLAADAPDLSRVKRVLVTKLRHHGVEIIHPEIDHPFLLGTSEVIAVIRERSESGGACFLSPGLLAVIRRHQIDAEMVLVPLAQRRWILGPKEESANSSHTLHTIPRLTDATFSSEADC